VTFSFYFFSCLAVALRQLLSGPEANGIVSLRCWRNIVSRVRIPPLQGEKRGSVFLPESSDFGLETRFDPLSVGEGRGGEQQNRITRLADCDAEGWVV